MSNLYWLYSSDSKFYKNIFCIWFPALLSTISTALLLLGFSFHTYVEGGSTILSVSVFVSQWFFPVLFIGIIGHISSYQNTKSVLIVVELLQLILLIPLFYLSLPAALIVFLLRGILDNCSKTARAVIVKDIVPKSRQEGIYTFLNSSLYIGFSCAGFLTWYGLNYNGVYALVWFSIFLHALNIFSYFFLPRMNHVSSIADKKTKISSLNGFKAISSNREVLISFVGLVLITAFLQGFHSIARVALPSLFLNASLRDVSILQACIGPVILLALVFYTSLRKNNVSGRIILNLSVLLSAFFLLTLSFFNSKNIGIIFYLFYFFFFEIAYTKLNNDILVNCKKEESSYVIATVQAFVLATLAITTLILGGISDYLDITAALYLSVGATALTAVFLFIYTTNSQKE